MKRVLLLAYYFPPRPGIGSLRALYLAKYLPRFDWEVTVVTPRFHSGAPPAWATVVYSEYTDVVERLKRSLGFPRSVSTHEFLGVTPPRFDTKPTLKQRTILTAAGLIAFPDNHIGWLKPGQHAVSKALREENYHAIISTSYPYTAHLIANRIVNQTRILWLADLRDAWHGYPYYVSPNRLQLARHKILERKTLQRANAITTVSKPLADFISANIPTVPVFEIPNAFDPDEWANVPFAKPLKLTLTYPGSLGHHRPNLLFEALKQEFDDNSIPRDQVSLVFYGKRDYWLEQSIETYDLRDVVRHEGFVERSIVLRAERATSANLLLLWDDTTESGMYTGKFFEFLGSGRPILAVGGPSESVVRDVMSRTGGWYVRSVPEIRKALRELYALHVAGTEPNLSHEASMEFSANSMAAKFAKILSKLHPT